MRHGSRTAYLVYTGLLAAAFLGMIAGPVKSNSALLLSSASISASSPIYSGTGPYAVTLSASAGGNPANLHVGNGVCILRCRASYEDHRFSFPAELTGYS